MLIQFRFNNFRSFKDDTILDLSATKIREYPDHVITLGKEKILPTAAVYGANASGKSNVVRALGYMAEYVINSFAYGGMEDYSKSKVKKQKYTPFLFANESKDAESMFEVYFIVPEKNSLKTYNYGFALNRRGVTEEWLNIKSKTANEYTTVFYRGDSVLDLSGLPEKNRDSIINSLYDEALIVSLGAMQRVDILKNVYNWFHRINIVDFGDPEMNMFLSTLIPNGFATQKSVQKNVVGYFSAFDPSIVDFDVKIIKTDDNNEPGEIEINAVHRIPDSEETASIPLEEESGGTLKMFALYPHLLATLRYGSVLIVDELNSKLHPLLVRAFLLTFLNPETNPNHAQLIFTSHDSWQLSSNILRRDEIWFTEKDSSGVSSLYSLADFKNSDGAKIRKDESYEKNYLLGKYGAIPTLNYFDILKPANKKSREK